MLSLEGEAMTEEEWFAFCDWRRMLAILGDRPTDRKLRLFAVAVCRRIAPGLLLAPSWRALVVAEQLADGAISAEELASVRERVSTLCLDEAGRYSWEPPYYAAEAPLSCLHQAARYAVRRAIQAAWLTSQPSRNVVWAGITTALLRDIFGNPFRPVAFSPSWRTDTAIALARTMYESREFGAMPILADALQDAGCDNTDILSHCRDAKQAHVRGCWVVDLVLGKS
jgi:hypothetical protein